MAELLIPQEDGSTMAVKVKASGTGIVINPADTETEQEKNDNG